MVSRIRTATLKNSSTSRMSKQPIMDVFSRKSCSAFNPNQPPRVLRTFHKPRPNSNTCELRRIIRPALRTTRRPSRPKTDKSESLKTASTNANLRPASLTSKRLRKCASGRKSWISWRGASARRWPNEMGRYGNSKQPQLTSKSRNNGRCRRRIRLCVLLRQSWADSRIKLREGWLSGISSSRT